MRCHMSLPLSSHNPHEAQRAPTITIDDWPWGPTTWIDGWRREPTNIYETHHQDRRTATRTHHHHRRRPTARIDQWLRPPTTTIDERPQGPITTIDERSRVPTMTTSHGAIGTSFDKRPRAPTTINEWEIPIQTQMQAQMRRWTKHEPQPEHKYPPPCPYSWSKPRREHLSLLSVQGVKGSVSGRGHGA